jgi:hypothetical protein
MLSDLQHSLITRLGKANVLEYLMMLFDNKTLMTVLRLSVEFRIRVSKAIVKRVLLELFGCSWERYYDAYTSYYMSCVHSMPVPKTSTDENSAYEMHKERVREVMGAWGNKNSFGVSWQHSRARWVRCVNGTRGALRN